MFNINAGTNALANALAFYKHCMKSMILMLGWFFEANGAGDRSGDVGVDAGTLTEDGAVV